MTPNKHRAVSTVIRKVNEIKFCLAGNNSAISNSKTIEILLDSILSGLTEESATKLRLVK